MKIAAALFAVCMATCAFADVCPIDVCNYADPDYQAAYARYRPVEAAYFKCVSSATDPFFVALDRFAVLYPRFGIAYRAFLSDLKSPDPAEPALDASKRTDEARSRFEDRILTTAEPEALEFYNLLEIKMKRDVQNCGEPPVMPEPPKKVPG